MSKPKCNTCGGEDFFTDAGFFYCAECQTQSQDIREEVFDEYFTGQRGTIRTIKKSNVAPDSPSVTGNKLGLTTWEILNYVLKGLVDEIIKLGSKEEVKIAALQMWASYLYKLEVAFTSSNIARKPRLSLFFRLKDAEIIYGVAKEKVHTGCLFRNRRKRSSSASSGSNVSGISNLSKRSSAKKAASAKKALVAAEYEETFSTIDNESLSQDVSNQTLETLKTPSEHSHSVKSRRIKLTKHAKSLLKENLNKLTKIKKEKDRIEYSRKLLRRQATTMHNMTLAKVIALLKLALLFSKEDIHIGDILRWITEGHLSTNKCEKFIPDDVKIPLETHRILDPNAITHSGQHMTLMNLCSTLDITELPTPDLCKLSKRYCLELQLPDDFATVVQSWITHTPKKMITMETKFEARTMAYIAVLLKMVYSLDGATENKLSELASKMNRSPLRQGDQKLFVWTDWVQYIECRKSVVSSFHHVTRQNLYKYLPGHDSQLFLDHYEQTTFKPSSDNIKTVINEDWKNAVHRSLNKLDPDDATDAEIIRFPATLTPLYTYCKLLITEHRDKLFDKAKVILDQEFTTHSTSFLFNPKSLIALGLNCDLDILLQAGIANTCVVEDFMKPRESVENLTINRKFVRVHILPKGCTKVKEKTTKLEKTETDTKEKENDYSEIVSDDSSDEEEEAFDDATVDDLSGGLPLSNETKTSVPFYETRQSYWICHKRFESNDEFNDFAADMFPSTFLWLIRECASVVGITIRELYEEIMFLEAKKNVFSKSSRCLRKRKKLNV